MNHYKKLVLEKSGAILDTPHRGTDYDVTFVTILTADGHDIYAAMDQGDCRNVMTDRDLYYGAASMQSEIESAINLGSNIYVDQYILDACELDDDSDRWEHLWNEWYGEMKSFNF
jgi:hypothetical protein